MKREDCTERSVSSRCRLFMVTKTLTTARGEMSGDEMRRCIAHKKYTVPRL